MLRSWSLALLLGVTACDSCGARPTRALPVVSGSPVPSSAAPRVVSSAAAASAAPPAASSAAPGPLEPARELTWTWEKTAVGPMRVVVSVPAHRPSERFPVLVALHGRGEAFKGPARGARGWLDDYGMKTALTRLHSPPLSNADLEGLAEPNRLASMNAALAKRRYEDLIVVCPYTPDILAGDRPFSAATPFGDFVVDELLPRVRRETPAIDSDAATGIDGVSLGGRVSILVGFEHPTRFGAVAALQAAFDSADAPELARRATQARARNPKLFIRLLTSEGDFFLRANQSISRALRGQGVEHELVVLPGPHDYPFNRGPGVYEMLLFHDRALRGRAMLE